MVIWRNKIYPCISAISLAIVFISLAHSGIAQNAKEQAGNWLMYFGMNKISNKFSIHSEVQYRNHTVAPVNIEQLLLRAGLNYHFSSSAFATGGYGYISSYDFESDQKNPESEEHRIWQQLIMVNTLGRVKFEHRYRIEQRWVNDDYRNRLRYRLMLFLPLNKPKIEKGTLFIGVYDEIFVNTEKVFFDRNRLYGALGYQFHKSASFQLGMLRQQVNSFGKNYLQFALVFNPDFRQTEKE
ncbi:MAG: DUF2490 domain-containing protein [Flavobacteriales bacterium]|nr:DUF2490 domain-containing protein [Flavobacteriales bacterium]